MKGSLLTTAALLFHFPGLTQFTPPIVIEETELWGTGIVPQDVEGDGDLDLIISTDPLEPVLDGLSGLYWLANDGTGNFGEPNLIPSTFLSARHPQLADMDGDGLEDILYAGRWPGSIGDPQFAHVWVRNNGNGTYGTETIIENASGEASAFAVGDVDLNGTVDVVRGHAEEIRLHLNQGSALDPGISLVTGLRPIMIKLHDMNDDDTLDLIYSTRSLQGGPAGLYIRTGNGDGSFGPELTMINPGSTQMVGVSDIACFDMNADGWMDMVVPVESNNKILLYNGNGTGFNAAITVVAAPHIHRPGQIAVDDLDNDGDIDLLIRSRHIYADSLFWFSNNGFSFYKEPYISRSVQEAADWEDVECADLNGDGLSDAVKLGPEVTWFANGPAGQFGTPVTHLPRPTGIPMLMDIDGDNDQDLITRGHLPVLYRHNGWGNFGPYEPLDWMVRVEEINAGDVTGDGITDLVVSEQIASTSQTIRLHLYKGNLDGTYEPGQLVVELPDAGTNSVSDLIIGDIDQDGINDIVFGESDGTFSSSGVYWVKSNGASFLPPQEIDGIGWPSHIQLVDLTGDGQLDVVSAEYTTADCRLVYFPNNGGGSFGAQVTILFANSGNSSYSYATGDIDNDGDVDIVGYKTDIRISLNDGSGSFTTSSFSPGFNLEGPYLADMDQDGNLDIVVNSTTSEIFYYNGVGDGTFGSNPIQLLQLPALFDLLGPTDLDGDNAPDLLLYGHLPTYSIAWSKNLATAPCSISGQIFFDENGDGMMNGNDHGLPQIEVAADPFLHAAMSDEQGNYSLELYPGVYDVDITLPNSSWTISSTPAQSELTMAQPQVTGMDIGLTPTEQISLVETSLSYTAGACGAQGSLWVSLANHGTRIEQGVVSLETDPLFTFISSDPTPFQVNGNQISWIVDDLQLMGIENFHIVVGIPNASSAGSEITFHAEYIGDEIQGTTPVFSDDFSFTLGCSYDPNDKQVEPLGFGYFGAVEFADADHFDYTIRFQNTGTGPAYTVLIEDQLPETLDPLAVQVLGSSHTPSSINILPSGRIQATFDEIMLPDSSSDVIGSQGFVKLRIGVVDPLVHMATVNNTAAIYFDQNEPVITNTTLNILVDCSLWQPTITILSDELVATEGIAYQWFLNDNAIPDATDQTLSFIDPGTYTVEATSIFGCTSISDDYNIITTSITSLGDRLVIAYPNPCDTYTQLVSTEVLTSDQQIEILDIHGRQIAQLFGNDGHRILIPTSHLASGFYFIRSIQNGRTIWTIPIMKG